MQMVTGALCRTKTGLYIRQGPGGQIVAELVKDALVQCLGKPVDGWVRVVARGWTLDGLKIYSEPDMLSSLKLTTRSAAAVWRFVEVQGAVGAGYLDVVDGPK